MDARADVSEHPRTPDGRYVVVRGRLWRLANPHLAEDQHDRWVRALMTARRDVRTSKDKADDRLDARRRVDEAKRALGERGPVWWDDGAPDYNRHLVKNSPYAAWFGALGMSDELRRRRSRAGASESAGEHHVHHLIVSVAEDSERTRLQRYRCVSVGSHPTKQSKGLS